MTLLPLLARGLVHTRLSPEDQERLKALHFADAGHGFDAFGMHRDFVGFGLIITAFLYERYFRVLSYGAENLPKTGPVVVVANHSGTLPMDAAMLWADVVRKSNPPRIARPVADHFVPMMPVIGTLFARSGMVGGSRGNARTLLEAGEMIMIFPEGVPGISKHFRDRYHLTDWRVGHIELAIRHQAPVVPVGIVGPEEQMPQLGKIDIKLLGAPFIPIPLTPIPLPVRYHILYGEPIPIPELYRPEQADDPGVVREAAARSKVAVEALLKKGLKQRKGIFA
jgi:1-acyl-sn-glycerol-3-phosphate acyltransferase